ncbi:hypothetical protein TrVE_jg7597 [Triparma verrucosa]|uniref:Uncharacterized protein n=1 Tax=Triparma verrucosa TaxID=1606542 RepID=A0A9W7FM76_9STRA|nr:hypothetical protein TrVE_jg7597 [Triparma verrucosa]
MSDSLTSITSVFLLILRLTTAIFIGLSLGLVWCTFDFNGLPNRTLWDARSQDPGADGSDASWNTTRAFAIITACFSAFQVIGILFNFITCNKHPSYSAQMIFDLMIWVCACISWGVTSTNKGLISFSLLNVSVSIPSNKVCNQGAGYQFMQSAFALALISWVVGVLFVFPGFAAKCMTEKKPSEAKAKEAADANDVELEEGKE